MLQQFMFPKTADIEYKSGQCVIFIQDAPNTLNNRFSN